MLHNIFFVPLQRKTTTNLITYLKQNDNVDS